MTFSRSVTIAGWIVIAVAFAAAWAAAVVSRGRFPTLIAMLRAAMRNVVVPADSARRAGGGPR